jgi:hypothetical protein
VIDGPARDLVRQRAGNRCEYRRLRQEHSWLTHHIEHIVAKQHGGSDEVDNLALARHRCNLQKGPNLTGFDRDTSAIVPLFNPRRDEWDEHFAMFQPYIEGRTPTGRVTVQVLAMNDARRVQFRSELILGSEPL